MSLDYIKSRAKFFKELKTGLWIFRKLKTYRIGQIRKLVLFRGAEQENIGRVLIEEIACPIIRTKTSGRGWIKIIMKTPSPHKEVMK